MYNREREDDMNRTTTVIQKQLANSGIDENKNTNEKGLNKLMLK